ncbi:Holliday junction resolvase RuvX [Sodalis-like symbiont of Philaenus spumarius]|nr:Holliday junction resolvase RuvX [Sodalis-like symbiont of Philaenus spumarius]
MGRYSQYRQPNGSCLKAAAGSIMAFDFGTRSIGVAIGQRVTCPTRPLTVVVGLPLNMDSSEQRLTARVRKFANRLHGRFGVQVVLHDERLSTVEAHAGLFERGGYRALEKGKIDAGSAVIILESSLEQFPE